MASRSYRARRAITRKHREINDALWELARVIELGEPIPDNLRFIVACRTSGGRLLRVIYEPRDQEPT